MMTLYMVCVVAGGVLMGTSIFLGGDHDSDADFDADVDADMDLDVDHDVEVDHDMEAHAGGSGGFEWSVLPFGSLRFWTFLVESFGLAGAMLTCAGIPTAATLGVSLAIGTAMGWMAFTFFRWLAREEVSGNTALTDYTDSEARVLVRIPVGGKGKIAIETSAGRVELLAVSMDGQEIARNAQVLVIGVKEGLAEVTALAPSAKKTTSDAAQEVAAAARRPDAEKNL